VLQVTDAIIPAECFTRVAMRVVSFVVCSNPYINRRVLKLATY